MTHRDLPATTAWLLMGMTGSARGVLEASGGRVSFTVYGSGVLGRRQLRRLEEGTGLAGLAEALWRHDAVAELFDVPVEAVGDVAFPWYYLGCGMKLTVGGQRYKFSFTKPQNTSAGDDLSDVVGLLSLPAARRTGKMWRELLTGAGATR